MCIKYYYITILYYLKFSIVSFSCTTYSTFLFSQLIKNDISYLKNTTSTLKLYYTACMLAVPLLLVFTTGTWRQHACRQQGELMFHGGVFLAEPSGRHKETVCFSSTDTKLLSAVDYSAQSQTCASRLFPSPNVTTALGENQFVQVFKAIKKNQTSVCENEAWQQQRCSPVGF